MWKGALSERTVGVENLGTEICNILGLWQIILFFFVGGGWFGFGLGVRGRGFFVYFACMFWLLGDGGGVVLEGGGC